MCSASVTLARAVVSLSVFLVGCATTREQPSTPYSLTNSDITAVVTGIRSAQKDLDNPGYRNFTAARQADGQIYVCGWMNPTRNSSERPFIGILSAGQFVPKRFGGDNYTDSSIIADCRNRGVGL
jgi:hypothetical protein